MPNANADDVILVLSRLYDDALIQTVQRIYHLNWLQMKTIHVKLNLPKIYGFMFIVFGRTGERTIQTNELNQLYLSR